MKRIAIWYHSNFGRNDGPPLYYLNCLQKLKDVEVVHLVPEGDASMFGKFDFHFCVDYGEDGLPVNHEWELPKDGGKTIYVCSDAHIDENGRNFRFNKAKKFDYVFFNQVRFVDEYKQFNPNWEKDNVFVGFLPHAAEPEAYPFFEILKKWDVCFIGHVQTMKNFNGFSRVEALDRLFKEFPNFYFGTRNPMDPSANLFEDASKKFCQSKVVFNISIKDDLNMRLFEILSSGSFQLTNYLPTLKDIGIEDGVHLVTYKTLDEMVEKAKYYIEHNEERQKIAEAGHKFFLENHSYMHRTMSIFKTMGTEMLIKEPVTK